MSGTQEKAAPPTRESLLEEWSRTPSHNIDPATWWQRKAFALAEVNKELLEALEADLAWFIARPKLEGSYTRAKAIEDLIAKARGR